MSLSRYASLLPLVGYLTTISVLFGFIISKLPNLRSRTPQRDPRKTGTAVFGVLTVAALLHTWFYMFRFMAWSFRDYEARKHSITGVITDSPANWVLDRMADWVYETALFEQAWEIVCRGRVNWWWSEQLCIFTAGAWTLFLFTESRSRQVRHAWAFMLLGQIVAISVAVNLFFLHISMLPSSSTSPTTRAKDRSIPLFVCGCVLLSLGTVAISPWVMGTELYLPNLLVMHGLLIIPFLPLSLNRLPSRMGPAEMFTIVMTVSGALRLVTTARMVAASGGLPPVWRFLQEHPAKSSIGWDIVWTTISMLAWRWMHHGVKWLGLSAPFVAIGSIAPVACGWLAFDELAVEERLESEEKARRHE
ncbi:hypothetical protein FRB94_006642 [Tulasnella sp. JGI-2019a]|nr:hypothetical protein FRB94_006642 [Tulasnella sp. JGI-2019a]KAG9017716.1 hypothetical protein FRB93_004527 [Tulasnella sp. JGI-2019a]KAG9027866.1 hypothetical protein FRB95_007100 [Tulasnella sp. JGI-2019a]